MIKKIGILTSGGDAPGMNTAVVSAIRTGCNLGKEMYVIYDGYRGIIEKNFKKVDKDFGAEYACRGGTFLRTARFPEFKEKEVQQKAAQILKEEGIEALIVIGGDGSFMGAKALTELGINCIGIPSTIDNDIASTDFTIGFDTAINTVVNSIDNINETNGSHHRCGVIEIFGNDRGDLTLYAGLATHADAIYTKERGITEDQLIEEVKKAAKTNKAYLTVLIAEMTIDTRAVAKRIEQETGYVTKVTVLGHIQRGGTPTALERERATLFGSYAISLINQDIGGVCVGQVDGKLVHRDIIEASKLPRNPHKELYEIYDSLK